MTALPLSASADAPRDPCIEPIAAPATLPTEVRAYVTGQPDGLLVSWLELSPQAVDVLSARERAHALGLLAETGSIYSAEYRTGQCAAYVRERLTSGDHLAACARLALEPGAGIHRWWRKQVRFKFDGLYPFEPLPVGHAFPQLEIGRAHV